VPGTLIVLGSGTLPQILTLETCGWRPADVIHVVNTSSPTLNEIDFDVTGVTAPSNVTTQFTDQSADTVSITSLTPEQLVQLGVSSGVFVSITVVQPLPRSGAFDVLYNHGGSELDVGLAAGSGS
jgi:hypothetical protein